MTKEEVLGPGTEAWDFSHDRTVVVERDDALVAMDEYAKQQSIAFFTWYGVRMASFLEYITKVKPICESKEIEEAMSRHEGATFEQLYAKFVKDQSIEQQNK